MAGDLSDTSMSLPPLPTELPSWAPPSNHNSGSEHTSSTADFNRQRLRLASEVQRDFNDMSFSDVPPPGAADYEDTSTFDIAKDAAATSTRQYDTPPQYNGGNATSTRRSKKIYAYPEAGTGGNMLFQTPTINSQILRDKFADFSMPGKGMRTMPITSDEDTEDVPYEMGRAKPKNHGDSLFNNTSEFMSMDIPRKPSARKPSAAVGGARRRLKPHEESFGSPVQRSGFQTLNFDPSRTTPKRTRSRLSPTRETDKEHPSKIMDFVSSAGSGGSRGKFGNKAANQTQNRDSEEDALSDVGSVVRPRSRFQRKESMPEIKMRKASGNEAVPKGFKSTGDFLKELGLDGHTQTLNLQADLRNLKNPGSVRNPKTRQEQRRATMSRAAVTAEPTFIIPPMNDMTELFGGNEPTRFSMKKGAAAESHVPIESIPVPIEARAMLSAMKLLQEKVERLESQKARNQAKCAKLENDLKKAESRFQQEMRTRMAQVESRRRRAAEDSTFGSDAGDLEETQMEKARIELMMEKLRLESVIDNLKDENEKISQELDVAKHDLRNYQEERNQAVSSVALAISNGEDLKAENKDLVRQLEELRLEKEHAELMTNKQREEFKAREQRLKQRVRDAREAALIAEEAAREAARKDAEFKELARIEKQRIREEHARIQTELAERKRQAEREARRKENAERADKELARQRRHEARRQFDQQVEEKLRKIRPDLFENRSSPIKIPHDVSVIEVDGSPRVVATPKSRRSRKTPQEEDDAEFEELRERAKKTAQKAMEADETITITPEQIMRIARELSAERKAARAAARAAEQREAELAAAAALPLPEDKPKGRRILKVVYLMPDDSEVLELEKDLGDAPLSEALSGTTAKPTPTLNPADIPLPALSDLPNCEHSSTACTVCHRYHLLKTLTAASTLSNPLDEAPPSTTPLPPAPPLSPVQDRKGRRSLPAKTQLERVVRQLKDELAHLKILYQARNREWLAMEPSEREGRKRVVEEMRELVAEMDAKADQIWGLYDVNEGLREITSGECATNVVDEAEDDREKEQGGERPDNGKDGEKGVQFEEGEKGDAEKRMYETGLGDETEDLIRSLGVSV